jgi:hypothetical protein
MSTQLPPEVAAAYPGLSVEPSPFGTGLINLTLRGRMGALEVIVQRLHPVFAGSVHHDIEAVTMHLAARDFPTPRLIPTADARLWVLDDEGRAWRVQSFVAGGVAFDTVATPTLAHEAGQLVGGFHAALVDLAHDYVHVRPGVHDTASHLAKLEAALGAHHDHRLRPEVERESEALFDARTELCDARALPLRHAHGDLKISNLLFDAAGRGLCLVDLDTLGRMPLAFELGDALRSWCNRAREDERAAFDPELFASAIEGYASRSSALALAPDELATIVLGTRTIALELAARFLTDALEERYFGWDATRYPARGEHQLARARGQLALAQSLAEQRSALEASVRAAFARSGRQDPSPVRAPR